MEGLTHLVFTLQNIISHNNESNILHSTNSEFWNEDLVILVEWERVTEKLFIEFYSMGNGLKNELGIYHVCL